jgi:ubiquitin C-terminal hydrolase
MKKLQRILIKRNPAFRLGLQGDAEELLLHLLEYAAFEFVSQCPSPLPSCWSQFDIRLTERVYCADCDFGRNKHVITNYILLQLPSDNSGTSITDCLSSFCREVPMDVVWRGCEENHPMTSHSTKVSFCNVPEIFIIVLKRFRPRLDGTYEKASNAVTFETDDVFSCISNDTKYSLTGVVTHHGENHVEGHYTAFGWNQYDNTWYHYNDHQVSRTNITAVKFLKEQVHILFYVKQK